MKIIDIWDVEINKRVVKSPNKDFTSYRYLLKEDNMGYSITITHIPKDNPVHVWHYKNHLESCYCIEGCGILTDLVNDKNYGIMSGMLYVLDNHDKHTFKALKDTTLLCVFNPPLIGKEVHNEDGSYGI